MDTINRHIISGTYMADTMPSGLTLYTADISGGEPAYTLEQADGQGVTWRKSVLQSEAWTDIVVRNAVRNETDLHRLAQLLNMYGIESYWCNHVDIEEPFKETTITVVRPIPQDGDGNKPPARFYSIETSPRGLTWVNTYTRTNRVRATDHDAAMKLIEDKERAEQK